MDYLSNNVQIVKSALNKKGLDFEVIEFSENTGTSLEAAKVIGCDVAQITKSIIFRIVETNEPLLVLASGVNRIDEKKIRDELGQKIEKADANFVKDATGFVIGGVPPIGHKKLIRTYIDMDLMRFEELWAAAGTPHAVFKFNPTDLLKMTDGKIISVIRQI